MRARRREPGTLIAFFHGGGFVIGDIETHASFCAEMARVLDLPVVSVDYRLAPEHRWPAAPDDCEAAARWLAESPAALGRTVTALVLAGDSAGGNLAIVTADGAARRTGRGAGDRAIARSIRQPTRASPIPPMRNSPTAIC